MASETDGSSGVLLARIGGLAGARARVVAAPTLHRILRSPPHIAATTATAGGVSPRRCRPSVTWQAIQDLAAAMAAVTVMVAAGVTAAVGVDMVGTEHSCSPERLSGQAINRHQVCGERQKRARRAVFE